MRDEIMSAPTSSGSRIIRTLKRLVPKGSALDTIFDSYDDWREFEGEEPAEAGEKDKRKPRSKPGA